MKPERFISTQYSKNYQILSTGIGNTLTLCSVRLANTVELSGIATILGNMQNVNKITHCKFIL